MDPPKRRLPVVTLGRDSGCVGLVVCLVKLHLARALGPHCRRMGPHKLRTARKHPGRTKWASRAISKAIPAIRWSQGGQNQNATLSKGSRPPSTPASCKVGSTSNSRMGGRLVESHLAGAGLRLLLRPQSPSEMDSDPATKHFAAPTDRKRHRKIPVQPPISATTRWGATGSVEEFNRVSVTDEDEEMWGKWNERGSPPAAMHSAC
jgi:hypothetical protein